MEERINCRLIKFVKQEDKKPRCLSYTTGLRSKPPINNYHNSCARKTLGGVGERREGKNQRKDKTTDTAFHIDSRPSKVVGNGNCPRKIRYAGLLLPASVTVETRCSARRGRLVDNDSHSDTYTARRLACNTRPLRLLRLVDWTRY